MSPNRLALTICLMLALIFIATVLALLGPNSQWLMELLAAIEQGKREHRLAMLMVYIAAFALLATLTLPVGTLFCLAAGYLFGIVQGFLAALIGALLAAALTFILMRHFGGRRLRAQMDYSRMAPWLRALERDATWYLVLLRIVPVAPYFAVNAAAAVTRIGLLHFIAATAAGLVPITLVYAAVGAGLGSLVEARTMLGPGLLMRPEIGLPLLGLVALIMAGWLARRRLTPPPA